MWRFRSPLCVAGACLLFHSFHSRRLDVGSNRSHEINKCGRQALRCAFRRACSFVTPKEARNLPVRIARRSRLLTWSAGEPAQGQLPSSRLAPLFLARPFTTMIPRSLTSKNSRLTAPRPVGNNPSDFGVLGAPPRLRF